MDTMEIRRTNLLGHWDSFWFAPANPATLGAFRCFLFLFFFLEFALAPASRAGLYHIIALPEELLNQRIILGFLPMPILPLDAAAILESVWHVALLFAGFGLFTRFSVAIAALLSIYLIGLPYMVGFAYLNKPLGVLAMVIMSVSRCDSFSLDEWMRTARGGSLERSPRADFHWPLRLIQCLWVIAMLQAAANKLLTSGLGWIFSDNLYIKILQRKLLDSRLFLGGGERDFLGHLDLYASPTQARFLALGTILTQLCAPLALRTDWPRYALLACVLGMHFGMSLFLHESFWNWTPIYFAFIPTDTVARYFAGDASGKGGA